MATESQRASWAQMQGIQLTRRQTEVFEAIRNNPGGTTLFDLVRIMKQPVNQICGRVSELVKLGFLVDIGMKRKNPETGKSGTVYFVSRQYDLGAAG